MTYYSPDLDPAELSRQKAASRIAWRIIAGLAVVWGACVVALVWRASR